MITRVWGLINMAQSLPFYQKGERWFFTLPDKDGVYICEFWAENDFGSIGYNRAILYVQGGVVKCLRVISTRYRSALLKTRFGLEDSTKVYETSARVSGYPVSMESGRYATVMKAITCPHDMKEIP